MHVTFPLVRGRRHRLVALRRTSQAFTLVELLVAVAILTALAALLLLVLAASREQARCTICLSNRRQIGQAYLLYLASAVKWGLQSILEEKIMHRRLFPMTLAAAMALAAALSFNDWVAAHSARGTQADVPLPPVERAPSHLRQPIRSGEARVNP
jgi:prepilin-type N-terminal cleavage/methylation domain-containing protein